MDVPIIDSSSNSWIFKEIGVWICFGIWSLIKWIGKKLWDLKGLALYIYDIGSDILYAIHLHRKCHYVYVLALSFIFGFSHFTIVFSILIYLGNKKDTNCITKYGIACCYPLYFTIQTVKNLFQKKTKANNNVDVNEILLFKIMFIESILESLPSLSLSFFIILHHGIDEDESKFIQIGTLIGSFIR